MIVGKNGSGEEDVVLRNMAVSRQDIVVTSMDVCRQGEVCFLSPLSTPQRQMPRMHFTIPLLFARRAPTKLRLRYRQTPIALAEPRR